MHKISTSEKLLVLLGYICWLKLLLAEVVNHLAVHVVQALAGDVALQVVVAVEDGQPVGLGALEGLHHLRHGRVVTQRGGRLYHELVGLEMVVELGAEDDVADFQDVYLAQQGSCGVGNGQHAVARTADFVDYLSQFHVGIDGLEVALDDGVEAHERQHGMVGMVRDKLALTRQSNAVDAMRLEDVDGEVGADGDNHERHKEVVAAGYLGNEEDAGQGGMHHARHHAGHAQQGEVLLGHIDTDIVDVPQSCKEESGEAADEQRGCEGTAATAAAIGRSEERRVGKECRL